VFFDAPCINSFAYLLTYLKSIKFQLLVVISLLIFFIAIVIVNGVTPLLLICRCVRWSKFRDNNDCMLLLLLLQAR